MNNKVESSDQKNFIEQFKAARRAAVPIVAIKTLDNYATEATLAAAMAATKEVKETPLVRWDVVQGWTAINESGEAAIQYALTPRTETGEQLEPLPTSATINRVESLSLARRLPGVEMTERLPGAVLICHSFHRFVQNETTDEADTHQAILNLRNDFKSNMRTLVLLGPEFTFPSELQQHVLILDEPLPDDAQLAEIVVRNTKSKGLELTPEDVERAVDAVRGIAAFPAEQAVAMCAQRNKGVDFDGLWHRKRQTVAATPGLSIWRGGETVNDIGGSEQIIKFLKMVLTGDRRPLCIVHIDEMEKAIAGGTNNTSDSSGVTQGFIGELLQEMQDNAYTGLMCVGVAGGGKSLVAKAAGSISGIPTIRMSLQGMKGGIVGESERNLRTAMKVIKAVSGGRALFIATSNDISNIPAELRSRFTLGTWFFDLPTLAEGKTLWEMYIKKFGLKDRLTNKWLEQTVGWTGREVQQACDIASRTGMPLTDTIDFIVPVKRVDALRIEMLRKQAEQGFLWAAQPGIYRRTKDQALAAAANANTGRASFDLEGDND